MSKHRIIQQPTAFTLIELLVVISIIALLIAILLPALTAARDSGRTAACLSNHRQLMVAATAYSIDEQGKFPYNPGTPRSVNSWATVNTNNWLVRTLPYLNIDIEGELGVMNCPAAMNEDLNQVGLGQYDNSYAANGVVTLLGGEQFLSQSSLSFTSCNNTVTKGVAIRAALIGNRTLQQATNDAVWSGWMRFTDGSLFSDQPHPESRNLGYMDGHAANTTWQETTSAKFGLLINGADTHEAQVPGYNAAARIGRVTFTGR